MPGQATVTINNEEQWQVSLATTYAELTTGLSGVESIPAGTGMLFILPTKEQVTVDTSKMLFPLDIIFISESTVIDVASNIEPGYLVTEETPCDMFLEVNAGEAAEVEVGDTVTTAVIQPPGFDFSQIMSFAIPVAALGFVCAMAGGMAKLMGGSSSSPKRGELPQAEKVTVKCPICGEEIKIGEYNRVSRSEALKKHVEAEHAHHSLGSTGSQREKETRFIGDCKVADGLCHTHGYSVSQTVRCPKSPLTDEEWKAAWELAVAAYPEGMHNPWVNGWWPETREEAQKAVDSYAYKMRGAVSLFRERQWKAVENYERAGDKAIHSYRQYVMREYERRPREAGVGA
jgi:uncharacterized membrane protein (UPF0127 family)